MYISHITTPHNHILITTQEEDPFEEDVNREVHIGSVKVWLQSLSFLIEAKEQLEIIDYRGEEVGRINIELVPCDAKGKSMGTHHIVACCVNVLGKFENFRQGFRK